MESTRIAYDREEKSEILRNNAGVSPCYTEGEKKKEKRAIREKEASK